MATHDTETGRQHNIKLSYVLRWFLYARGGHFLFSIPKSTAVLPYGGQCLPERYTGGTSGGSFPASSVEQELIRLLKAEKLTPCLYIFQGFADGRDTMMPTIDIIGYARRKKLPYSDIVPGKSLDPANIPCFARQMLHSMKTTPVDAITCSESGYRSRFGFRDA